MYVWIHEAHLLWNLDKNGFVILQSWDILVDKLMPQIAKESSYTSGRYIIMSYTRDSGIHLKGNLSLGFSESRWANTILQKLLLHCNFKKVLRKLMCCSDFASNQNIHQVVVDSMSIDKIVYICSVEKIFWHEYW